MSIVSLSRRVHQMRTNDSVGMRTVWSVVAAVAATLLTAPGRGHRRRCTSSRRPSTRRSRCPTGTASRCRCGGTRWTATASAPSDRRRCRSTTASTVVVNNGEQVTVPGPRIVVPPADTTPHHPPDQPPRAERADLDRHPRPALRGDAGEAQAGRVRSMTKETGARSRRGQYDFDGLKPGTFLYQSGSHMAVQVQMGLYGAMTKDESGRERLRGVPYAHEALLLYSEIDPALHDAVATGKYGHPEQGGPTSTIQLPAVLLPDQRRVVHRRRRRASPPARPARRHSCASSTRGCAPTSRCSPTGA